MTALFAPIHIYVAGPMSIGDQIANSKKGINVSEGLMKLGFVPFCPQLSLLHHLIYPHSWEEWLQYDEAWLSRCDALFRIPGESKGADREEQWCRDNDIPVFYDIGELVAWAEEGHGFGVGSKLTADVRALLEFDDPEES